MLKVNLDLGGIKEIDVIFSLNLQSCWISSESLFDIERASSHEQADQNYGGARHRWTDCCSPAHSVQCETLQGWNLVLSPCGTGAAGNGEIRGRTIFWAFLLPQIGTPEALGPPVFLSFETLSRNSPVL